MGRRSGRFGRSGRDRRSAARRNRGADGGAVAGLVVVPVQPPPLDLWATAETLKMAQDERRRSLVVLNRVPPRSRFTEDIAADLASAGTPIAATRIGNRVALAQAMALG